jgi:DNA-binding MarR family transcriptional regulator
MKNQTSSKSNFDLWLLSGLVNHSILAVRKKELKPHHLSTQYLHILRTALDLGSQATLLEVARQVARKSHVVSRQTIDLEKAGLIRRVKYSSNSKRLRIELTDKGLDLVDLGRQSKSIDLIFSCLSEEELQQMKSILNKILVHMRKCNQL